MTQSLLDAKILPTSSVNSVHALRDQWPTIGLLAVIITTQVPLSFNVEVLLFIRAGWLRLQPGEEGKMPAPSFTLYAQLRFHDKWLKIDLQVCVDELMRECTV